jgi:MFS family permease
MSEPHPTQPGNSRVRDAATSPPTRPPSRVFIRVAQDVDRLIDDVTEADQEAARGFRRRRRLISIIALGGVFVDAYDFTSLSIGTVQLRNAFDISNTQVGAISACMAASALVGAFGGGYLADRLGRQKLFVLSLWLFIIAAIGSALAPTVAVLVSFRLLMGLGVGLDFPVALSFVAENTERRRRGRSVNASYINWYLAGVLGFLGAYIGYVFGVDTHLWRLAVGSGAIPAGILLILRYLYVGESPLWAAHHGDLHKAANILRRTHGLDVEVITDLAADEGRQVATMMATIRLLFSPKYRPRAILAAIIACAQSVEYFALVFYLPVISQLIFGATLLNAILGGIIFSVLGLVGSSFQAWVCDRTGLRPLTIAGSVLALIALFGIALGQTTGNTVLQAVMVGMFMIGHTVGPGPQGMAYATLSFPTAIRATAIGWAQGMLRLGSIIGFLFFPLMLNSFGYAATFAGLAVVPVVILAASFVIRWEPIGVDVEQEHTDTDPGQVAQRRLPVAGHLINHAVSIEQPQA